MRGLMYGLLLAGALVAPVAVGAQPAGAQSGTLDRRVDRLEGEVRAVQRVVFPGGAGKYVSPEITAPDSVAAAPGTPASSPVADLDTRVSALERAQATLTGAVEQNQHRLRQLEDEFAAYKRTVDARFSAGDHADAAPDAGPTRTTDPARTGSARPNGDPAGGRTARTAAKPVDGDPDRAGRVSAIDRPKTDDPADDGYVYGYRLYTAGLYPEAEAALKGVADTYPKHRRASWAQNLLGRSYLDEGRPSMASMAFYDSFKKFPDGERAPDSLYYLAQSLVKLNKPADACKVYAELDASYGSKLGADLKAKAARGRADAKCK